MEAHVGSDAQKTTANPILAMQILAYHRAKNQAIGAGEDDTFLRGLHVFALSSVVNQIQKIKDAAYLSGAISEYQAQIKRLIASAKTSEMNREILPQVTMLYNQAEEAARKLEQLTNG